MSEFFLNKMLQKL